MDLINRKIFVTGASGFIGRHVVEHLQNQGAKVTVLLRTRENPLPGTRPALGDVSRYEQVSEFVARNDAVIHLAGLVGVGPCADDIGGAVEANILGTLNVLAAMRSFNTPGVFAGVGNVDDLSVYPITKAAAERFVHMYNKEHGTKMVPTRVFNVYGPGQPDKSGKLVTTTVRRALAGSDLIIFGDGSREIDFVHVDDAAALIVAALERAERGEVTDVVDIGTGVGTTVRDAVETIRWVSGSSSKVVHQDVPAGEAQQRIVANPTRMHWPDGFEPRNLVLGIKETVEAAR